jgi:histidinol phosphatase-like PHP family hydrolase
VAAAVPAVEVNTAGWHTARREAYPEPALLHACRERGLPTRLNADAPTPASRTRDFNRAVQFARATDYTEVVRFANRR